MAQYEELTIDQGSDQAIEIHLGNPDGSVKDLTGFTATAQLRKTINTSDSDAVSFISVVVDPADKGIITLLLTNAQTNALKHGRYFYDVEISYEDSDSTTFVERVMEGIIRVTPSITRT